MVIPANPSANTGSIVDLREAPGQHSVSKQAATAPRGPVRPGFVVEEGPADVKSRSLDVAKVRAETNAPRYSGMPPGSPALTFIAPDGCCGAECPLSWSPSPRSCQVTREDDAPTGRQAGAPRMYWIPCSTIASLRQPFPPHGDRRYGQEKRRSRSRAAQ